MYCVWSQKALSAERRKSRMYQSVDICIVDKPITSADSLVNIYERFEDNIYCLSLVLSNDVF